jgi:dihydroneopterin aldolase
MRVARRRRALAPGAQEQRLGQKFLVDLTLEADLSTAGRTDDIKDTVDYAAVYGQVPPASRRAPTQPDAGAAVYGRLARRPPPATHRHPRWPAACLRRRQVKAAMEGPPHQLLESVAHTIAQGVLERHGAVSGVHVSIQKPHVAMSGVLESLGIEISRYRD